MLTNSFWYVMFLTMLLFQTKDKPKKRSIRKQEDIALRDIRKVLGNIDQQLIVMVRR